jgi:flagellin
MSYGIGSVSASSALRSLSQTQQQLANEDAEASSGLRVQTAADDPSGLAISQSLIAEANGYTQATQNITNANDALTVAGGSIQSITSDLQTLRSLAVEAASNLTTPSEAADLQTQANQLIAQINTEAQTASYNGVSLLSGQYGSTPAAPASANITANASLSQGGTLVTEAQPSSASVGGTITASVVQGSTSPGINVNFTSNATGQTTYYGVQAAGTTLDVSGTTLTLGSASTADIGQTATVQVNAATVGSNATALNVQSGATEGATTGVSTPNATSDALGIGTIDLSTTAGATNAIGQIDQALANVEASDATVGAQTDVLDDEADNDTTAATELTASASNITDANEAQLATNISKSTTQEEITTDVIAQLNAFQLNIAGIIDQMV